MQIFSLPLIFISYLTPFVIYTYRIYCSSILLRRYDLNAQKDLVTFPNKEHYSDVIMGANHQPHDCLLNRLFRGRSKKTSKPRVTGLCEGNSPVTGELPAQRTSNAENVSIWWRHHDVTKEWYDDMQQWGRLSRLNLVATSYSPVMV